MFAIASLHIDTVVLALDFLGHCLCSVKGQHSGCTFAASGSGAVCPTSLVCAVAYFLILIGVDSVCSRLAAALSAVCGN